MTGPVIRSDPLDGLPSLVGTAVPSRPFAQRAAHHLRVSILNSVNGGLGTTRPTLRPLQ